MQFSQTMDVATAPQRAFDYLADVTNEPRWNPWGITVEKLTAGPIGQDTRFVGKYKRIGTAEQWLAEYDPPRRVVYQAKTMDGRMEFDLEPLGAGTRIRLVASARPAGAMRLILPLMTPMMRRHVADMAEGLRRELGPVG